MTYTEFNDTIRVYVKRSYGYESRARLLNFTFDERGRAFALVYNEETKKFLTIPIEDVRFVNDNVNKDERDEDNNIKWYASLFGDDTTVTMDTLKKNFRVYAKDGSLYLESKDCLDDYHEDVCVPVGSFTPSVREKVENDFKGDFKDARTSLEDIAAMEVAEKLEEKNKEGAIPYVFSDTLRARALCKQLEGLIENKEFSYPVKEVLKADLQKLVDDLPHIEAREHFKQDVKRLSKTNPLFEKCEESIAEAKDLKEHVKKYLKEEIKDYHENADKDTIKGQLLDKAKEYYQNASQTEEPKTDAVSTPDEDWKYNGGSC